MRIVLILAVLAAFAMIFDVKWLGALDFLFIFGCAVFWLADFVRDCVRSVKGGNGE